MIRNRIERNGQMWELQIQLTVTSASLERAPFAIQIKSGVGRATITYQSAPPCQEIRGSPEKLRSATITRNHPLTLFEQRRQEAVVVRGTISFSHGAISDTSSP